MTDGNQLKPEVVRTIAHGELLYRVRHAQNQKQAEEIIGNPAGQFGPTPKHLASSQRMTPGGISDLYCVLGREACVSEIRSITGDHVVSVALTASGELRLLDLTALDRAEPPALTLLDKGFRESLHQKVFLGSLVKKMSRPKVRDNKLSYLSAQAVFENLRLRFGKYVDGLVFSSVQTGEAGTNVTSSLKAADSPACLRPILIRRTGLPRSPPKFWLLLGEGPIHGGQLWMSASG